MHNGTILYIFENGIGFNKNLIIKTLLRIEETDKWKKWKIVAFCEFY